MNAPGGLHRYFTERARAAGSSTAAIEPGQGSITYAQLDHLSDRVRDRLVACGVQRGDRVGIYLPKSIDALAVMYGALKAGAAYVPVDAGAPSARCAYILQDCKVRVAFVDAAHAEKFDAEARPLGELPVVVTVAPAAGGQGVRGALDQADRIAEAPPAATVASRPSDLAYILYTSGSTGKPKGVMLSHDNAVSFVDWCSEVFEPTPSDRFSSHAPLHFDLSILDVHVCLKHGATLVLISYDLGKDALRLAQLIAGERITIWYSAPSILALLAQFGQLKRHDHRSLRHVLFAGEVFAVKHLRSLCEQWPGPRYFNLYGPTETNVCTYHEVVPPVPEDRTKPYPIGRVCSHLRSRVLDEHGADVPRGSEGELCIAGRGVMKGYWGLEEQTARGFHRDAEGTPWYRTGDVVVEDETGCYTYLGRRDRMVKRRGYRVELGEIEVGLYRHPRIREAAVVATTDADGGVAIHAFLSSREPKHPSLIEMKRFAAEQLPLYMLPDRYVWLDALPKTSTDKVDYQRLKGMT